MPLWLQVVAIGAVLASAAWVYAAAALWLVGGAGRWYWRVSPLALLMTALLPIGAYELLILFSGQVTVILTAGLADWAFDRTALVTNPATPHWRPQFGLRDLIGAVALLAMVLAIGRNASFNPIWSDADHGWLWIMVDFGIGAGLGAIARAISLWVDGRLDGGKRTYLLALAAAATVVFFVAMKLGSGFLPGDAMRGSALFEIGVLIAYGTLTTVGVFTARRMTRPSAPAAAPDRVHRSPRAGYFALAVTTLVPLIPLVDVYRALLPPTVPTPAELPKPNGYDLVTQLEATLNWTAIPNMDVAAASAAECQQFARDNQALFVDLHEALKVPSRTPLDYYDPMSWSASASEQARRNLGRALYARARAEASLDQPDLAVATYLELVELGNAGARGGAASSYLVALNAAGVARAGIFGLRQNPDFEWFAALVSKLTELESGRDDLEDVIHRELLSDQLGFGWFSRMNRWVSERLTRDNSLDVAMADAQRQNDAEHRLLLTHLALQQFQRTYGELPASLAQLAPIYLPKVPQDPYGNGPLVYRRKELGYDLYSIGHNGRDDGGRPSDQNDMTVRDDGDLVLESLH